MDADGCAKRKWRGMPSCGGLRAGRRWLPAERRLRRQLEWVLCLLRADMDGDGSAERDWSCVPRRAKLLRRGRQLPSECELPRELECVHRGMRGG